MDFKDMTVQILDSFLTNPTADKIIISRELCTNLFDVMKLMTWFYGPNMTYDNLKKNIRGEVKCDR